MPTLSCRIVFMAAILCGLLKAQAIVNETRESTSLWVSALSGVDTNPGTLQLPLQTIGAAALIATSNNRQSIGTHITIMPGIYRESIVFQGGSRTTSFPMTFEAATPGTVTISGAVRYTSWNRFGSGMYTTPWAHRWGFCPVDTGDAPYQAPIVLRPEMTYVNGVPMTEVMSLSEMKYPGTFFVDETGGTLYLWPPAGIDPSIADVEVAELPTLLTINGLNGVVFRNVTFEYASSCHHDPAVLVNGTTSNVLFDTVSFDWNNGEGIALNYPAGHVSVISSTANHNGAAGFQAYRAQYILWQNDTASYNNWRGAQGVYYEWGTGGAHIFSDHNETWTNFKSTYNQTHSMHWDTDDQNITADKMLAAGNLLGVLIEKNLGPISITNSTFCNSQIGIAIRDSSNVKLSGNVLYNNSSSGILLNGVAGGFVVDNWSTEQPYTTTTYNTTLTNNVIQASGAQNLFKDGYLGGSDWVGFVSTLHSSNNVWWNPTNGAPFVVPTPNAGTQLNFAGWQALTFQDVNSSFGQPAIDPAMACSSAVVDSPDWWLVVSNLGQTSTSPTGIATTGASGQATYNISNIALGGWSGTASLAVDGVQNMAGASVVFDPPAVAANGTSIVTVSTTTATPPGTYPLTIMANSGDVTRTMAFNVTVPLTSVRLSKALLNFPNQPMKITSAPQTITLTNFGTTPIAFTGWVTSSGFAATNTCGSILAGAQSCTISVTFTPHQSMPYAGTLTISDSDATATQVVSLTGTSVGSPTITLSIHSMSFGGVNYGSSGLPQTVVVTNTGTGILTVSGITLTGPDAANFHETDTCAAPVEVNSTCAVTVTFSPATLGVLSATLAITGNAPNSPATIALRGNGLTALTVSPKSISFGSVNVGKASNGRVITITNLGASGLSMGTFQVSGTNAADFVLSAGGCGASVPAKSSCTVTVTYVPVSGGARSAMLPIVSGDPGGPLSVTFTGTANAISVSPNSINFGTVVVGKTSLKTVTITNAGTASVTLNPLQITGPNANDMKMSGNTCGSSMSGKSACSVTITFMPPASGARSATLTVSDSDPSSPSKVALTGAGK